jgi:CRISPR-associated protein Csc2
MPIIKPGSSKQILSIDGNATASTDALGLTPALAPLLPYLGDIDRMTQQASTGRTEYIHPTLKNMGNVSLVLIREAVAPVVFRNQEQEITDIMLADDAGTVERHVRGVPGKLKHKEKQRGLQISRFLGIGGRHAQNRTMIGEKEMPSAAFDINTLVFGDSTNRGNRVLPVKAAGLYSDAISVQRYEDCTSTTFHNRANESGTLWDDEAKENSSNIFNRHFIIPGAFMVQVLSTQGCVMPIEALRHLLLCIGEAGTYGGQTSSSGVNIRTTVVGAYASRLERAITAPGEIVRALRCGEFQSAASLAEAIDALVAPGHEIRIPGASISRDMNDLGQRLIRKDDELIQSYRHAAEKIGNLFDAWFIKGTDDKAGKPAKAA